MTKNNIDDLFNNEYFLNKLDEYIADNLVITASDCTDLEYDRLTKSFLSMDLTVQFKGKLIKINDGRFIY